MSNLVTLRLAFDVKGFADFLDGFFLNRMAILEPEIRKRYSEYVLLQTAYDIRLFRTTRKEVQTSYPVSLQKLFIALVGYLKEPLYEAMRSQYPAFFTQQYEYELAEAYFHIYQLRVVVHQNRSRTPW